jgi:predicted site-specific integrase-resolvase
MKASAFAKSLGISPQRVRVWCNTGRIPRAYQEVVNGVNTWFVPDDAVSPEKLKPGIKPGK